MLSTATSSGKSLVYNAVVFEALLHAPDDVTAFYIFPTKALGQDQRRVVRDAVSCGWLDDAG